MGPYPHDAPPAEISAKNPAGIDGFEFVEFSHEDRAALARVLETMGFAPVARHKQKDIVLWRQGSINFLANTQPGSHAAQFAQRHGPCASAMGWRVVDAKHAFEHAVAGGAEPAGLSPQERGIDAPAIRGIGGSIIYFIERTSGSITPYDTEFDWIGERNARPDGAGLFYIDHLTHNVHRGNMDTWSQFYEKLFGFREIRYFDIKGEYTGLFSRALTSPCGKVRIPINESADDRSQIEEYLRLYRGEGIQHVACGTNDIYRSVDRLRDGGLSFMPSPPSTYYERIDQRLPGHGETIAELQKRGVLIDGETMADGSERRLLLQIFSGTVLGPIFFEFIQRKGDDGFGEGNFRALFESIEEDQIRRGVLHAAPSPQ